jgi:hypothetical protein
METADRLGSGRDSAHTLRRIVPRRVITISGGNSVGVFSVTF